MDFSDVLNNQVKHGLRSETDVEYVFWHVGAWRTYYNIYPTYAKVLLEAIKPRYWKGRSVILLRPKAVKVDPKRFDSYT